MGERSRMRTDFGGWDRERSVRACMRPPREPPMMRTEEGVGGIEVAILEEVAVSWRLLVSAGSTQVVGEVTTSWEIDISCI